MDNASKALIMAGAVLIAVALVGVGVYLYQSAAGTVGTGVNQLNAAEMQTMNSKYERYLGTGVLGSDIKSMIRAVNTDNAQSVFPEPIEFGDLSGKTNVVSLVSGSTRYDTTNIVDTKTYHVYINYKNGFVHTICVY